ncbi:zinc finger protein 532-like [Argopecten irradians]|uniref:zinc finger protein 532-like n=1 Tax=Argopecten irradians TaxID=31199 RepID=UPI00371B575D
MDTKSDEVDGKPASNNEVGDAAVLSTDCSVTTKDGEVLKNDPSISVISAASEGVDITRTKNFTDQENGQDQISTEDSTQAEASVCAVTSSSEPEETLGHGQSISEEKDHSQTPVSNNENLVSVNREAVSMDIANQQTPSSSEGNTVPDIDETVSMETANHHAPSSCEGNTLPNNSETVSIETANQQTPSSCEGNTEPGNNKAVSIEADNFQTSVSSEGNSVQGITETVSMETTDHHITLNIEGDAGATESSPAESNTVQESCTDNCETEGNTIDHKQSTDIAMETEDSAADSGDFSQIQIMCVQSMATDSSEMDFEDRIQTSSEDKDPMTAETTTVAAKEASSRVCVTSSVEETSANSDVSSAVQTSVSSDEHNIASSEERTSDKFASSTEVRYDFPVTSAVQSEGTLEIVNVNMTSSSVTPSLATTEVQSTLTMRPAANVSSETNVVSEVCSTSKPEEMSEKSSNQKQASEVTLTFDIKSSEMGTQSTVNSSSTAGTSASSSIQKEHQVLDAQQKTTKDINHPPPIGPQVLAVQPKVNESQDTKKTSASQKFSMYTLNKARSMLQSALGTMPVVGNHQSHLQQLNPNLSTVMANSSTPVTKQSPNVHKPEEHGDILDILKTHSKDPSPAKKSQDSSVSNKSPGTEKHNEKKDFNQVAKKSTSKKPVVPITGNSDKISIKQEPADSYNGYGTPSIPSASSQVSTPSIMIENVHGNHMSPVVNSNNNSILSQVNCVSTTVSTPKLPVPISLIPSNPALLTKLVASDPMRTTAPSLKSTTLNNFTKNKQFVPVLAGLGPANGQNRVTIRLSNSSCTTPRPVTRPIQIPNMPGPQRVPRPIQPKGLNIRNPVVNSMAVNRISTPALLQTNATFKTTVPPPMPVSSINIDTVGLPRITELIARKNPIPNYKAPGVPENLKEMVKDDKYLCYECGDSFWIHSSLSQHRGRYSMKITFKCDECNKEKCFFNKCQFLGHLRQHLNIDKSQAVPIHIKSDSISIEPLPKIYESLGFQTSSSESSNPNSEDNKSQKPAKKRCHECGSQLTVDELLSHLNTAAVKCDFWHNCSHCNMALPSMCALRAHRRLHSAGMHSHKEPSNCPECGKQFMKESDLINYREPGQESCSAFIQHMRYECCHLNRITQMSCSKCKDTMETGNQVKNHILSKLDQYYKCQVCPMAFRTMAGFERHFATHRRGNPMKKDCKRIYKCHVCDTVLDDLSVLELHIAGHVKEFKQTCTYAFLCIDCRQVFPSKEDLIKHIDENHTRIANKTSCMKCNKTFGHIYECFVHDLMMHRSSSVPEYRPCKNCGEVMELDALLGHPCFKKKTTKEKYVCNFCDKEIFYKKSLTKHMLTHKKRVAAVCIKCFRTDFSNMEELKDHEETCSRPKQDQSNESGAEQCIDCNLRFKDKEVLEKHRANHHLFPCHLCGATYQSKEDLKNHVSLKHVAKRNQYPCQICNSRGIKRVFSSTALLDKHLSCRHRQGKNPVISQKFIKQEDEESSSDAVEDKDTEDSKRKTEEDENPDQPFKKLRVEGETRFTCAKCSLTCEDRETFLEHLRVHKVENFIQCFECGLSFAVLPSLRKHLFMVHKVKDFNTYCRDNGIEEAMDVDYDKEIRDIPPVPEMEVSHDHDIEVLDDDDDDRNPLECRVCHRVFESETDLRTHTRTHGMAFIRNKRRNKMVPSANVPPPVNGVNSEEEELLLSAD